MRASLHTAVAVVALATLLASCSSGGLKLAPSPSAYDPDDYDDVLDDWTRGGEDHHQVLEGRLFVTATYHSPDFRQALLTYASSIYAWDPELRAEAEARQADDETRFHTFFVAVATGDWRWNRLDEASSPWYLWLEDDAGRRVRAVSIRRVRDDRPEAQGFYPYLDAFKEGYYVRFPRPGTPEGEPGDLPRISAGTRHFELLVTGAPGEVRLRWELEE